MLQSFILIVKKQVQRNCQLEEITWDDILEYLNYENSDYRIIDLHGTLIKDFKVLKKGYQSDEFINTGFKIEFKENVSIDDLEKLIMDKNSDYKATRIRDYKVLKEFKPEVKERGIEKIKKYFKR